MIIDPYGIDHHVGFLHQRLDLALGISTVIVAAIGDDQQRFLWILRFPHLAYAKINCVQQGGPAFRHRKDKLSLQVVDRLREVRNLLRTISESNKEELVL